MAEVQIPMALGNRIIFVKNVKAKPSSHRSRTPGFLRIAPIDSGQQITELGRGDRHRAVGRARPQKAAPFQPLRKQAGSLAVMPDHLQKIAPASTKAKQLPAQRITSQHLLHLQRQARKALPHVGVTGRQPHPDAARNWDHGRVSSPRMIRSRVSTSMSQSTITRRPFALTISIRPQPGSLRFSGCSATIIAGTNPRVSPSCPSRYALRQPNSSWLEIPCRRAVADASRGPEKLSSTIRSFSAADHRRRRPVSTISRRLIWRVSVRSSIPTISYRPANSTRRPTSDEYLLSSLQEVLRPAIVQVLRDPLAATQLGNAVLAAQAFQNDPDLLLGRIVLARRPSDVLDNLLSRFLQWSGLLSHLRSYERYDEPETLPYSIHPVCPMSADGGQ